jgi:multidrug efflux system outer membrane protein
MTEPTLAKVDPALIPAADTTSVQPPQWQDFFHDPMLKDLITASLAHNRDLRLAAARIQETRAAYGISQADRLPSIDVGANANRTSTPADVSPVGRRMNIATGGLQVTLPSYELDLWGRVAQMNAAALATFLSAQANAQTVLLGLIGEIANTYYQWQEARERLRLLTTTKDNRTDFLNLIEKRLAVGMAIDTERLQAQAVIEGLNRDMVEMTRQQRLAEHQLVLLVGQNASILLTRAQTAQSISIPIAESLPEQIPSAVLLQRPDIRSAEQTLQAANANVAAARAAFLPRISLTGSYGTASSALNGLFASNSDMWSFVPQITLPLFNSGRTQANLDLAAARQISADATYEKTIQTALKETADALTNRSSYAQQILHQRYLLSQQQQRLALSEKRYLQGLSGYLEVLDAQRECQVTEQTLVQLVRQQRTAEVQLFKALGGNHKKTGN